MRDGKMLQIGCILIKDILEKPKFFASTQSVGEGNITTQPYPQPSPSLWPYNHMVGMYLNPPSFQNFDLSLIYIIM